MSRLILAAVNPDNTPHGYNLTFAFPMLLFIIIGGILYLLFSRPHRRTPARPVTVPARSAGARSAETAQAAAGTGAGPAAAAAADGGEPATDAETEKDAE